MNIEDFAPIPRAELDAMRWLGERSYRVLSHSFSLRWNGGLTGDRVDYVWGGFAVPSGDGPEESTGLQNSKARYSLVDLGPEFPRRYRLLLDSDQLISSPRAEDVLGQLLWQIFKRMHEQTHEFLLVHAGSVVTPRGEAVLLPAGSGFGKTTLVAGLVRAGYGFLSDEIGVLDHRDRVVRPYPRAMNFKERLGVLFSDGQAQGEGVATADGDGYLRAEELRPDAIAEPCRARFVIAPRYREGTATKLTPLTTAATVKELWMNAVNADVFGAEALPILAEVARAAEGYRLTSGDLPEAVQAVKDVTSGSRAAALTDSSL